MRNCEWGLRGHRVRGGGDDQRSERGAGNGGRRQREVRATRGAARLEKSVDSGVNDTSHANEYADGQHEGRSRAQSEDGKERGKVIDKVREIRPNRSEFQMMIKGDRQERSPREDPGSPEQELTYPTMEKNIGGSKIVRGEPTISLSSLKEEGKKLTLPEQESTHSSQSNF